MHAHTPVLAAARGYINTAGRGQFITFIVWVKAVSVGADNREKPG